MTQQTKEQEQLPADQNVSTEDAGLEFGYSGSTPETADSTTEQTTDTTDTTKDEEKPAAQAKPEQPAPAPQAEQPLTRAEVANLLDGRFRNFQGNINKLLDERLKQLTPANIAAASAAAKKDGGEAPTNAQVKEAMASSEKMEALKADFPEFAAALEEQAAALESKILAKMPKAEVDTTKYVPVEKFKTVEDRLFDTSLELAHPGWKNTINTPEFAAWLEGQPDDVKQLGLSESPDDGIAFIGKYVEFQKAQATAVTRKQSNQSRLQSAVAPSKGGARPGAKQLSEDDGLRFGYNNA